MTQRQALAILIDVGADLKGLDVEGEVLELHDYLVETLAIATRGLIHAIQRCYGLDPDVDVAKLNEEKRREREEHND